MDRINDDFRIFIDAATLKLASSALFRATLSHFRIFIDAATLKQSEYIKHFLPVIEFPHLYRCGHIEARSNYATGQPDI